MSLSHPFLQISDGQNSFCINAIKYCNSSKLDECVFQFKLDSNQLFTSLYPTMLIELETSNNSEGDFIKFLYCFVCFHSVSAFFVSFQILLLLIHILMMFFDFLIDMISNILKQHLKLNFKCFKLDFRGDQFYSLL